MQNIYHAASHLHVARVNSICWNCLKDSTRYASRLAIILAPFRARVPRAFPHRRTLLSYLRLPSVVYRQVKARKTRGNKTRSVGGARKPETNASSRRRLYGRTPEVHSAFKAFHERLYIFSHFASIFSLRLFVLFSFLPSFLSVDFYLTFLPDINVRRVGPLLRKASTDEHPGSGYSICANSRCNRVPGDLPEHPGVLPFCKLFPNIAYIFVRCMCTWCITFPIKSRFLAEIFYEISTERMPCISKCCAEKSRNKR